MAADDTVPRIAERTLPLHVYRTAAVALQRASPQHAPAAAVYAHATRVVAAEGAFLEHRVAGGGGEHAAVPRVTREFHAGKLRICKELPLRMHEEAVAIGGEGT